MLLYAKKIQARLMLTVFTVLLLPVVLHAQQKGGIKSDVENFIRTADIQFISKYFKGYTEVEIPGFSGVVNHVKAQMLIKDFFKNKKTDDFSFKKEESINGLYFIILDLNPKGKTQNLFMLFKKDGQGYILQKIEIG